MVCRVGDKLAEGAWVTGTWSLLTLAILASFMSVLFENPSLLTGWLCLSGRMF